MTRDAWEMAAQRRLEAQSTYPCAYCHTDERLDGETTLDQYDPYGIYAGKWHDDCWADHGYGGFVFDAAYAGESLEEPE